MSKWIESVLEHRRVPFDFSGGRVARVHGCETFLGVRGQVGVLANLYVRVHTDSIVDDHVSVVGHDIPLVV
jgi:hypothetical protein